MYSYEYKGFIITAGHQWYATKRGVFICEASTDKEVEAIIDQITT